MFATDNANIIPTDTILIQYHHFSSLTTKHILKMDETYIIS